MIINRANGRGKGKESSKKMGVGLVQHLQELLLFVETSADAKDEGVGEKFFSSGSFSRVLLEAACEEIPQVLRSTGNCLWGLAGDHDHGDDGLHPQVTRLALAQLHQDYPQRPDIHALSVLLLPDQLWRHPCWCPCQLL